MSTVGRHNAGGHAIFALIIIPVALFWTLEHEDYLDRVTAAPWEYVGVQERPTGGPADGSAALIAQTETKTFILFKRKPMAPPAPTPAVTENAEAN